MVGLQLAGLDPVMLLVWGTVGNVGGSMFNYCLGRLGRMEWIEKYLHVKRESVEKAQHWMERKGAWVGGVLCVVPVIGDAISVALGFMRANWLICLISITIGKLVRYAIFSLYRHFILMKMKLRPFLFYLSACLCLLTGCKPSGRTDNKDTQRPVITVSIEPLRYITERITGDGFRVETFVPKGSSPETYEPTPEQMMKLGQSLVYFTVGDLGFERTWTDRLRQMSPEVPFVRTSESIKLIEGHHHGSSDTPENETDPHVWTSPAHMKTIAQKHLCLALQARHGTRPAIPPEPATDTGRPASHGRQYTHARRQPAPQSFPHLPSHAHLLCTGLRAHANRHRNRR